MPARRSSQAERVRHRQGPPGRRRDRHRRPGRRRQRDRRPRRPVPLRRPPRRCHQRRPARPAGRPARASTGDEAQARALDDEAEEQRAVAQRVLEGGTAPVLLEDYIFTDGRQQAFDEDRLRDDLELAERLPQPGEPVADGAGGQPAAQRRASGSTGSSTAMVSAIARAHPGPDQRPPGPPAPAWPAPARPCGSSRRCSQSPGRTDGRRRAGGARPGRRRGRRPVPEARSPSLVVLITLFGSGVAYWQAVESNREDRAARDAQRDAITGLGAQADGSAALAADLRISTDLDAERQRQALNAAWINALGGDSDAARRRPPRRRRAVRRHRRGAGPAHPGRPWPTPPPSTRTSPTRTSRPTPPGPGRPSRPTRPTTTAARPTPTSPSSPSSPWPCSCSACRSPCTAGPATSWPHARRRSSPWCAGRGRLLIAGRHVSEVSERSIRQAAEGQRLQDSQRPRRRHRRLRRRHPTTAPTSAAASARRLGPVPGQGRPRPAQTTFVSITSDEALGGRPRRPRRGPGARRRLRRQHRRPAGPLQLPGRRLRPVGAAVVRRHRPQREPGPGVVQPRRGPASPATTRTAPAGPTARAAAARRPARRRHPGRHRRRRPHRPVDPPGDARRRRARRRRGPHRRPRGRAGHLRAGSVELCGDDRYECAKLSSDDVDDVDGGRRSTCLPQRGVRVRLDPDRRARPTATTWRATWYFRTDDSLPFEQAFLGFDGRARSATTDTAHDARCPPSAPGMPDGRRLPRAALRRRGAARRGRPASIEPTLVGNDFECLRRPHRGVRGVRARPGFEGEPGRHQRPRRLHHLRRRPTRRC